MRALDVLFLQGSTMTVPELRRKADEGIVAPLGIERCSSFVIGLKTKRDMIELQ